MNFMSSLIYRQWARRLRTIGIETALDLKQVSAKKIRNQFNVILERTVHELNGTPCQKMELITPDKQEIVSSRAFSQMITDQGDMQQAVARHVARAAEKLRKQKGACKRISVGITTNVFKQNAPQYHNWASLSLIHPSYHTGHLIERSKQCLARIWKEGYEYKKATVMLSDISDQGVIQYDLFAQKARYSHSVKVDRVMDVLDKINIRMGRGACRLASEGTDGGISWSMKRYRKSPGFTTFWDELPIAFIK